MLWSAFWHNLELIGFIIALSSYWSIHLRCISVSASQQIWPNKISLKLLTPYNKLKIFYIERFIDTPSSAEMFVQSIAPTRERTMTRNLQCRSFSKLQRNATKTSLTRIIAQKLFLFVFDCRMPQLICLLCSNTHCNMW